jgi:hypothetical protein
MLRGAAGPTGAPPVRLLVNGAAVDARPPPRPTSSSRSCTSRSSRFIMIMRGLIMFMFSGGGRGPPVRLLGPEDAARGHPGAFLARRASVRAPAVLFSALTTTSSARSCTSWPSSSTSRTNGSRTRRRGHGLPRTLRTGPTSIRRRTVTRASPWTPKTCHHPVMTVGRARATPALERR